MLWNDEEEGAIDQIIEMSNITVLLLLLWVQVNMCVNYPLIIRHPTTLNNSLNNFPFFIIILVWTVSAHMVLSECLFKKVTTNSEYRG